MKRLLTLIFITISTTVISGGYGLWSQKTPGKNGIIHVPAKGGYTNGIVCKDRYRDFLVHDQESHTISNLKKWYFYKNHIMGEYTHGSKINYFIFNELNCHLEVFKNEQKFRNRIKQKELKPFIWTRWYNKNHGVIFTDGHIGDKLTFAWFYMPIIIGLTLFFIFSLIKTKFNLTEKINKINLIIAGIILLRILLDFYPQSF